MEKILSVSCPFRHGTCIILNENANTYLYWENEMLKSFVGILVVFMVLIASAFSSFADCTSNCRAFYDPKNPTAWDSLGIQVGQPAVNFFLLGTDGKAVNLSKLWADKPLFLEFGAYT
jgi:hypothetical protein